jgi:hypothetical protein
VLVVLLLIALLDCCAGVAMEVGDAQPASSKRPSFNELSLEAKRQLQDAKAAGAKSGVKTTKANRTTPRDVLPASSPLKRQSSHGE